MSLESNIYQIVILIDIKNLRNDSSYKRNVVLGSLKLLTFYSARARSERRQLQWGFAFFDESSFFSKALPSCKFRDFDAKNFNEFEGLLDKLSTANDEGNKSDPDMCPGCFDRFCECKKNAPAVVLARCFTEILTAFAWDSPDISSPVKPTLLKRLNDSSSTLSSHKRRITRNSSFIEEKEVHTNAIMFFSKCPLSMEDLVRFTLSKQLDKSSILLEEFMPSGIRKDFCYSKKIDLFWIDTHTKIYDADISGMCLMAEALSVVGKLLTLQILFGTRDQQLLMLSNSKDNKTSNDDASGRRLPDSATLMHYLVTPSSQCLYNKDKTNAPICLYDKAGHQIAELYMDLITWNAGGDIPHPVKMITLGTLPLCGLPLTYVQSQPVFGIRESTVSEQSVWSQLLTSLAKKHMVLVVENHFLGDPVPIVCLLQALTSISASLTYLKSDRVIDTLKQFTFQSAELVLNQNNLLEFVKGQYSVGFTKDPDHSDYISRRPAGVIKFDPELLEVWLLPKALPSSLGTFLETSNCGDLEAEDVDLLEQLQRTYMYHKSKRLTDVSSANKNLLISPRRSPRKKCERQLVRRSPRKAVRTRAALLARGPGSNQSLPELELHGRSATAPTRVDLIMQKSKQTRCQSTDEAEKKPSRKSAEASSEQKYEEPDFNISCAEELLDHIMSLHKEALDGQRTPASAMTRATALVASFTSKNSEVTAKELLKKSIWLTTAELSKKYTEHTQAEKIREFECQLVLWMEAINRGWLKDKDTEDAATDEVVMILRRLSFLQDPGALNLQLADLLDRYGDNQPSVLCTIYKELGHPLPSQLQGMFSPDDLDMTLDSQAPGSVLSFVDSVQRHSTRLQSNKQGTRKVMRHTSFHVLPQRQIKVAIPNKDKKDRISRRRSARIASTTKVKHHHKHDDDKEAKQVRRNLFSAGGAKLERCQSVAVMETGVHHQSTTSESKQKHKANHHRRSLVTETPAHKQRPNQTWQRQERWRRRTHTATAEVTVIQESPDKKTVDIGKGTSQSGGVANFVRRASFYSGAPDKISRAIQKCEMLEARMTKRLLSPPTKLSGSRMLTVLTPRRRIQPTTLFSKLLDPSPCKPKPGGLQTPTRLARADSAQQRCADFSSPSKNTRGRMRLFQSPSPKQVTSASKLMAANNQEIENDFQSKTNFMSPIKNVVLSSCFDSPSKHTRLQSKLQSVCQERAVSSSNSRMLFHMSPCRSVTPVGQQSKSQTTPTKIKHLFQSPSHTRSTPRKALLHRPLIETPTKQTANSESCTQGTPTRCHTALSSVQTPRKTPVSMAEFSSPSKNTRSHSKIFKSLSLDTMMLNKRPECSRSIMTADNKTTASSSSYGSASSLGFLTSVMTSSQGNDVKIFASAAFTNASSSLSTALSSSSLVSPLTSRLLLTPSKSTRSQTRLCPSLSSNQSSGTCLQGITSSAPSMRNPVYNSAVSQRLFSSPAKQMTKPLTGISIDSDNKQVGSALILSPGQRKLSHSSSNLPQRKRKLSFLSSPDKCQNTPSKRHHSSVLSSSSTNMVESSTDYFDCNEVFIEKTGHQEQAVLSANSSMMGKLSQRPPNPSVEQLRHHSTGSSIPSPVFNGLEKAFTDQLNSNSSPISPVFESTTPQRQNKENSSDVATLSHKKCALTHFSPQLSQGSISHLVTSPMLSPTKYRRRQRCEDGTSPLDAQQSQPFETSANRANEPIINNQSAHKQTPKSCKRSFCRMPTKLSL